MNNNYMHYITKYARVLVALVLALLISEIMVKEVFLGYTPNVRPDLATRVVEGSMAMINVDNYIAFFQGETKQEKRYRKELENAPYHETLIPGVYAKETENAAEMYINVNEVEWVTVPYTKKNGDVVELNIPAGVDPPEPGLL